MTPDERALVSYITAAAQARQVLAQLRATEIAAIDVQRALCEKLQIDEADPYDLLEKSLSAENIVQILRDFDFHPYHPEVLAEIELEEGILPEEIPRLLTEKTVKLKGEIWQIHKNDVDPFPSVPHAHNYDAGITLHLGTGEFFNSNRMSVGKIGKKNLVALRGKLKGLTLPPLDL
jgi:hypothetical protein